MKKINAVFSRALACAVIKMTRCVKLAKAAKSSDTVEPEEIGVSPRGALIASTLRAVKTMGGARRLRGHVRRDPGETALNLNSVKRMASAHLVTVSVSSQIETADAYLIVRSGGIAPRLILGALYSAVLRPINIARNLKPAKRIGQRVD